MSIGSRIKDLREKKGLSRIELARRLNVTVGAISNYENGVSSPKEPILLKIIEVLGCDANYLFQDVVKIPNKTNDVTMEEYEHIKKYRSLDAYGQETVRLVLNREIKRVESIRNYEAQIKQLQAETAEEMYRYPYLHKIACAGTSFAFDDIPTDTISVPYMRGTDFIIGVLGESMEPTFYDGDLLYVKKTNYLNYGNIGIFAIGNEWYVKEFGEDGLISHNPDYEMIPASEDIMIVGKVIGKVEN